MQISDGLSVIGFFWWYPYRISVHAKTHIGTALHYSDIRKEHGKVLIHIMFYVRYSWRIIWLELLATNNDPGVIMLPYLLAVLGCKGKHLPSYMHI